MTARARTLLGLAAVAALLALLAPRDAEAIPAFARKYRFSCTTCHAPFPRLKPYGAEFAGRGFRVEGGAEPARATRTRSENPPASPASASRARARSGSCG